MHIIALSHFVNRQYRHVVRLASILNPNVGKSIYYPPREKLIGQNKKSYIGYNHCGVMSYFLCYHLQKQYPEKEFKVGYSRHQNIRDDHVCIRHNDIIIDPTYRQFLIPTVITGKTKKEKYLFEQLPPFFVGKREDLEKITNELSEDWDDIGQWWKFNDETNIEFDLYDIVHRHKKHSHGANMEKVIAYLSTK